MKIDTKKGTEVVSNFWQKTTDAGKKTIADMQAGAAALAEKNKQEQYQRRLKKYNPLFPEVYFNAEFNLPNIIMIRDDAERRGIDVCEGAIGWLGNEGGMEILFLYDEFVSGCGLKFVPAATCDAIYYVDSFDRKRFIRTDCIFSKAHEERLAELKHVAYSLGAKNCTIEIIESNTEMSLSRKKASIGTGGSVKGVKVSAMESLEQNSSRKSSAQRSGRIFAQFEGSGVPKEPTLKWFAQDDTIKNLIEMRCKGNHSVKSETLELSGASSATMSQKTANAIDGAIGAMKIKGNSSMESQAVKESHSTLIFSVEF